MRKGVSDTRILSELWKPTCSLFSRSSQSGLVDPNNAHLLSIGMQDLHNMRTKLGLHRSRDKRHAHDPQAVRLLCLEWCERAAAGKDSHNPIMCLKFEGECAGAF